MGTALLLTLPLLAGYLLDLLLGDPEGLPHPVRLFGHLIATADRRLNRAGFRLLKGAVVAAVLCALTFLFFWLVQTFLLRIHPLLQVVWNTVFVFYGLANRGLIREGKNVFRVLDTNGLEAGRKQLSRIVGRDTSRLTHQQVRIAVLETMSENLSDGVVAPLFFYALAGVPGMMTYKMINTLDSMIGYRTVRHEQFGKFAARADDVAGLVPARLTAFLMAALCLSRRGFTFIFRYGHRHKSPNAGYPEAALAGILDLRFGGPNIYHGVVVEKPYIGRNTRAVMPMDMRKTVCINQLTCFFTLLLTILCFAGRYGIRVPL